MTVGEVRFNNQGWPCVPLLSSRGEIVSVVCCRLDHDGAGPVRLEELEGNTTLGTFGDSQACRRARLPVIITEGWADYLTARIRWPERVVVGVNGAGRLQEITVALAPKLRSVGIVFVPRADDVGEKKLDEATVAAVRAGVPLDRIRMFNLEGHNDLNDWHVAQNDADARRVA